ncbi:hypothetical protein IGI04_039760, partial [Brassica rapa subsp. trilocularis]
ASSVVVISGSEPTSLVALRLEFRFREVEASKVPSLPVLFPGGGSFLSSAFAGFSLRGGFYLCFCGFGLVLMEELSSEDD